MKKLITSLICFFACAGLQARITLHQSDFDQKTPIEAFSENTPESHQIQKLYLIETASGELLILADKRASGKYRARYFDTTLGRFISRDPLGYVDGMGLYNGYFAQEFIMDPMGQLKQKIADANEYYAAQKAYFKSLYKEGIVDKDLYDKRMIEIEDTMGIIYLEAVAETAKHYASYYEVPCNHKISDKVTYTWNKTTNFSWSNTGSITIGGSAEFSAGNSFIAKATTTITAEAGYELNHTSGESTTHGKSTETVSEAEGFKKCKQCFYLYQRKLKVKITRGANSKLLADIGFIWIKKPSVRRIVVGCNQDCPIATELPSPEDDPNGTSLLPEGASLE